MNEADQARWQTVKTVFHEALDTPPERRGAFVADACAGDPALRAEVDSLLESDGLAGDFIEQPAATLLVVSPESDAPQRLQPGARLGRYEILEFLGAGAVSEVYRARDTRLGRTVALKLLTDTRVPEASEWLLREAQHASTLNHRHIYTVHEVDEDNGRPYIVLEHIEGTTLHAALKDGSPSIGTILRWGAQIADALDHAHTRGIVHRDLKASNVVVTMGSDIKVLDFGLARRISAHAPGDMPAIAVLTDASVAGTLTHIAPEVFRGGSIDARIDIWALGVMLYEMACGRLPFKGDSPFATATAILETDPPPLPASVPQSLQRVILRCLSKNPADRYQTAAEVRAALDASVPSRPAPWAVVRGFGRASGWLLAAGGLTAIAIGAVAFMTGWPRLASDVDPALRLVAVLPLRDEAGDESQRFLADGMTEALIAELGRLDAVRVIAPATTARFRDRDNAVRDVARETRAAHVLDAAITRDDDRVRLSAQLIEAATGRVMWSQQYERHVRDLQALYGAVAAAIAGTVEVSVGDDDLRRLSLTRAVDPDVYEAYLKGRYYWNLRTRESLAAAITHFEAGIALDPSYAPAYAALADGYNQLGTVMVGGGSPQEWRRRAASAAIKALQIDPGLAEAHATLGYVQHYNWEWDAAETSLRRAIALNPSYALGRIWYANLLSSRGRADEAIREVTRAQELDPLSPVVNTNVAWVLINHRRFDEAIVQLERTRATNPTYIQARSRLGDAYSQVGRHDEAIVEFETAVRLSQNSASSRAALAQAYARAGRRHEADRVLDELVAARPAQYISAGALANAYIALGRMEEGWTWLEQSYRERTNNMAYLGVEPTYDPLRRDPRFQALIRAVGLP